MYVMVVLELGIRATIYLPNTALLNSLYDKLVVETSSFLYP
jgi:hypothetical protein